MANSIKIDVSEFRNLANNLDGIDDQLAEAGVFTVNSVSTSFFQRSKELISQQVNLDAAYVAARMSLAQATLQLPTATIEARTRPTLLSQFGAQQLIKTVKNPARSKGDTSRGIPAGSKAAGVSVQVHPGRTAVLPFMFLVRLKNANGFGVFSRTGKGKAAIRNRYGPSIDQVFKSVIADGTEKLMTDLETVLGLEIQSRIIEQLAK